MRSTGSPAAKLPVDRGDAGGQQRRRGGRRPPRPRPRRACSAPARRGRVRQPQQPRRRRGCRSGRSRCRRPRRPARRRRWPAAVSTTGMPAAVAIRAASTLVAMPPVPTPAAPAPADVDVRQVVRRRDLAIRWRRPAARVAVVQPVHVRQQDERVGPHRWATRAASRSLSPKRISSVATVSFSLTIGMTPSSSSRSRVRCALR